MLIDFHLHMEPGTFNGKDVSADAVLKNLDHGNVDRGVVFPLARWEDGDEVRRANDYVAENADKSKGRLIPFCSVNPASREEAVRELERCATNLGVKGLKLHPLSQGFSEEDSQVVQLINRAGELGLIVLIDTFNPFAAASVPALLKLAIMDCPETNIVFAHSFATKIDELLVLTLIEEYGAGQNVYCDLSAVLTMYEDSPKSSHFRWLIEKVGARRFLFGSDFPIWSSKDAVRAVKKLDLGEKEKDIMGGNAAQLLNL